MYGHTLNYATLQSYGSHCSVPVLVVLVRGTANGTMSNCLWYSVLHTCGPQWTDIDELHSFRKHQHRTCTHTLVRKLMVVASTHKLRVPTIENCPRTDSRSAVSLSYILTVFIMEWWTYLQYLLIREYRVYGHAHGDVWALSSVSRTEWEPAQKPP